MLREERELTSPMHDLVDNAECPGCRARSSLDPEHSYPDARACGACRGWFLERDTAYRFLVEELGTSTNDIARMLAKPGARRRRCPACGKDMSAIVILGDDVDLCPGCGGAWLPPGAMQKLSRGRYGKEAAPTGALTVPAHRSALPPEGAARSQSGVATAPPSAPPSPFGLPTGERPASPFGRPRDTAAAATAEMPRAVTFPSFDGAPLDQRAGALDLARPSGRVDGSASVEAMGGVAAGREPERAAARHPVVRVGKSASTATGASNGSFDGTALGTAGVTRSKLAYLLGGAALLAAAVIVVVVLAVTGGSDEEETPQAQPDATQKYAAYLRHYRFGGRNLDWWSARLTELSPGGAAADEKLFALTKDRAQRLGLVISEHPGRVEVKLSEPLTARLLDRLEVQ